MHNKDHEQQQKQAPTYQHPKQDFQVARIAFFSDAIFAISIAFTLLAIEFKVPQVTKDNTYTQVLHQVAELKYKFFALSLSFALIANYWMRHHILFKHLHNYNRHIVIVNMISLWPTMLVNFYDRYFKKKTK